MTIIIHNGAHHWLFAMLSYVLVSVHDAMIYVDKLRHCRWYTFERQSLLILSPAEMVTGTLSESHWDTVSSDR